MSERLFTDKLVVGRVEVLGVWSLDSATPATSAYPAHASGSPTIPRPSPPREGGAGGSETTPETGGAPPRNCPFSSQMKRASTFTLFGSRR